MNVVTLKRVMFWLDIGLLLVLMATGVWYLSGKPVSAAGELPAPVRISLIQRDYQPIRTLCLRPKRIVRPDPPVPPQVRTLPISVKHIFLGPPGSFCGRVAGVAGVLWFEGHSRQIAGQTVWLRRIRREAAEFEVLGERVLIRRRRR